MGYDLRATRVDPTTAVGGDFISTTDRDLRLNGTPFGHIPSIDSAGRPLPQWRHARVLRDGELLVGTSIYRSFDSRFVGPIRTSRCSASTDALHSIRPCTS